MHKITIKREDLRLAGLDAIESHHERARWDATIRASGFPEIIEVACQIESYEDAEPEPEKKTKRPRKAKE